MSATKLRRSIGSLSGGHATCRTETPRPASREARVTSAASTSAIGVPVPLPIFNTGDELPERAPAITIARTTSSRCTKSRRYEPSP